MGENINNLRYTGDTILLAEREELKSVMKVKGESEKAGLNLNIQRIKIMSSGSITSWQIDGETMETMKGYFFWPPKSLQTMTAHEIKRHLFLGRKAMTAY